MLARAWTRRHAFGWNATLVAAATAVLAALLAIFGYDWVHRVFRFLLVISFPCYAIISVAILIGHAGGTAPHHPGGFLFAAFMAQFSVAAAYNITYAPYVSDYSRYMPRKTPAGGIIGAVFFGASTSAIWLIALGAWLATRLGVSDGLVGLQKVGDNVVAPLGSITAVLSATALLATMGMNGYGGMLTVLTGIDSFKTVKTSRMLRAGTVVVLAIIWYVIGAYAWLVGLAVAGLVYLVLSRSLDLAAEQSAIEASERELQAIDVVAQEAAITEQAPGDAQAP
ncbi:MAG TPA: hypothetical protein VIY52_11040 [Streptosporangiaceae bacterium]